MKQVIALQNHDCSWFSEHLSAFTPNLFSATLYDDNTNDAINMLTKLKTAGHNSATEPLTVAGIRYKQYVNDPKTGSPCLVPRFIYDELKAMMEVMKNCQNCRHVENTVGYCALCTRAPVHKTSDEPSMTDRWELMDSANVSNDVSEGSEV